MTRASAARLLVALALWAALVGVSYAIGLALRVAASSPCGCCGEQTGIRDVPSPATTR